MHRNDRCSVKRSLIPEPGETGRPSACILEQTRSALGLGPDDLERTSRGSYGRRRQACRKNVTASIGAQVVDHQPVSGDEAADRGKGFAEGGHYEIDLAEEAE